MINQTTEYTLRVVVFLASLDGKPATTRQTAAATRVPEGYLAKVIQTLSRAGLITSQRGLHGGSVLARPANQITVLDVVNAVSPLMRIKTCPLNLPSHGTNLCPLHRRLDEAFELVEKAFQASTIADLLSQRSGSVPLTEIATDPAAATRAAETVFRVNTPVKLGIKRKTH